MNGYIAFVSKEFMENIKNYRFLILLAIFLIFGLTSPFLAKFTPDIISAFGVDIQMNSEPVALDAWEQFYKNISGIGFSAFIILFGSCLSNEYSKGTLVLMVTKGLSRPAVILAKYTVAAVLMTVCYWIGFVAAYGYTALLWPGNSLSNIIQAGFALWLMGFLYLSILILGGVLFKQTFTSILFAGGVVAIISLIGLIDKLTPFTPTILASKNVDLISGSAAPTDFTAPIVVSIIITILGLLIAIKLFNKKQL